VCPFSQEPPFFLGCSVALALRDALKSARSDAGIHPTDVQEFRYPLTSERLRMAVGDKLAKKAEVKPNEGEEGKGFFVCI
jgi:xanthine dehydrogenase/oxidase